MVYKRLLTDISIRILILTFTLLALVYFWMGNRDPLILLNLLALLVLQVYLFIRSQNRVNRKLSSFFESFRFDDIGFAAGNGFSDRSFRELNRVMSDAMDRIRQLNLANLRQKQYFQSVTEHAGVGILAFNERQEVQLINRTLKDLMGISELAILDELDRIKDGFSGQLRQFQAGDRKLIRISVRKPSDIIGEAQLHLSIRCTEIRLEEEKITVLTFQNIHRELEERELDSWQRVIHVIAHEITNSTGPIASSAQTLLELLEKDEPVIQDRSSHPSRLKEDLLEGLGIIRERSMGLEEFVQQFRQLTQIPEPKVKKIVIRDLFQGISVLFEKRFKDAKVTFDWSIDPPDLVLYADRNLVEQALINLMNNAVEAMDSASSRAIRLNAGEIPGRQCVISVTDSGQGIAREDLDQIFIPFYTSKRGGSGIGLSLVRGIMRMHRGSIQVSSDPGVKTTFRMIF